jgi:hydroxymethylbilane synthase
MRKIVKIGTRRSKLSRIQTEIVVNKLREIDSSINVEIVEITTRGDIDLKKPLYKISGSGIFVDELNKALLNNKIDLAVHSLKDYPTEYPETLTIASTPIRESAYDATVPKLDKELENLDRNTIVGTSSLRRIAHLKYINKDLHIVGIRGNIDTRIGKVGREVDLVILSEAGLKRLRYTNYTVIKPETITPQAGQGAIAVVARKNSYGEAIAKAINNPKTYLETYIERKILRELEGGCKTPLGIYSELDTDTGIVTTYISIISRDLERRILIVDRDTAKDPDRAIEKIVKKAIREGVNDLVKEWRSRENIDQLLKNE